VDGGFGLRQKRGRDGRPARRASGGEQEPQQKHGTSPHGDLLSVESNSLESKNTQVELYCIRDAMGSSRGQVLRTCTRLLSG
jgi:hypothetical protein